MERVSTRARLAVLLFGTLAAGLLLAAQANAESVDVRLSGHSVALESNVKLQGRVADTSTVDLAITLPLRNEAELDALIASVSNPNDPLYGHFLTSGEFTDRFAPTEADYDAVKKWAVSKGLVIVGEHPNRKILDVRASAAVVQAAFKVNLLQYQAASGRVFMATDAEPAIPLELAGKVSAVVGFDTSAVATPQITKAIELGAVSPRSAGGTGPGASFAPSDIKNAYGFPTASTAGAGQTIAVFELDGFASSDVAKYCSDFSLPVVPIENINIDGASQAILTQVGQWEVTLDIELLNAIAPGATKILNYTTLNTTNGILDGYNKIATDNRAKVISTSWGFAENKISASFKSPSESDIFKQYAAQGQSFFAPAGDAGAYDDGTTLSVDDPGSQPNATAVGGTRLTTNGPGGPYLSETSWNQGKGVGGGGGGISAFWAIPSWQGALVSSASLGSKTNRNVPDVSLNADPNSPYGIYVTGKYLGFGGTSAATPIWASFAATVNQSRAAKGLSSLGLASPLLYQIGASAHYSTDFHDTADGSTNQFYPAVTGYDLTTGLGSPNGTNLLPDLAPTVSVAFGTGINFIAVPYDYSSVALDTLFGYSGVTLAVWNPTTQAYAITPTSPANKVTYGTGYWVRFPSGILVSSFGLPASTSSNFNISLKAGWNQIGDPFFTAVPIANMTVTASGTTTSYVDAIGTNISDTMYFYNQSTNAYVAAGPTGTMQAQKGYWIYAFQNCTLTVPHP